MKAIYFMSSLIVVLTILSSCKKSDSGTTTTSKKLQTITHSYGSSESYEYNSDGKVSKIISSDGYSTYSYSGNTITESLYNKQSGITDINSILTLNSQGYASTIIGTIYDNLNNVKYNDKTTFEYDNLGFCTKSTYSSSPSSPISSQTYYTYTNGNMASETNTNTNGSSGYIIAYEYYLDKENTINYEQMGMYFFGKSSKNLIKKATWTSPSEIDTYTYEYDQDNYVTKKTIVYSDGTSFWDSYTWK